MLSAILVLAIGAIFRRYAPGFHYAFFKRIFVIFIIFPKASSGSFIPFLKGYWGLISGVKILNQPSELRF